MLPMCAVTSVLSKPAPPPSQVKPSAQPPSPPKPKFAAVCQVAAATQAAHASPKPNAPAEEALPKAAENIAQATGNQNPVEPLPKAAENVAQATGSQNPVEPSPPVEQALPKAAENVAETTRSQNAVKPKAPAEQALPKAVENVAQATGSQNPVKPPDKPSQVSSSQGDNNALLQAALRRIDALEKELKQARENQASFARKEQSTHTTPQRRHMVQASPASTNATELADGDQDEEAEHPAAAESDQDMICTPDGTVASCHAQSVHEIRYAVYIHVYVYPN